MITGNPLLNHYHATIFTAYYFYRFITGNVKFIETKQNIVLKPIYLYLASTIINVPLFLFSLYFIAFSIYHLIIISSSSILISFLLN